MRQITELVGKSYYRKMQKHVKVGTPETIEIAVTEEINGYQVWKREGGPAVEDKVWEPQLTMFAQANDALEYAVDRHTYYVDSEGYGPTSDDMEPSEQQEMQQIEVLGLG